MTPDAVQETAQDTPAKAWQHAWKKAARADARLKAKHLAVVDAFAECYDERAVLRGVGLSMERATYWTRLGSTAIRAARADLVRWGWLSQVRNHGPKTVARFALIVPGELGITGPVIPKEAASRPVKNVERPSENAASRPLEAVKRPRGGNISLPSSPPLPTVVPTATSGQPSTRPGPPRGRQVINSTQTPKTAVAGRADLERAIPPAILVSARGARSAPALASALALALAAGWTPEQVRAELDGADMGSTRPVGVCVYRMKKLAETSPPAAPVPTISPEDRSAAISAGQECEHGEADLINPATGLHICPICRRAAATA